jgi:hypothetical protein
VRQLNANIATINQYLFLFFLLFISGILQRTCEDHTELAIKLPPPSLTFNMRAIFLVISVLPTHSIINLSIMAPKNRSVDTSENPMISLLINLDHIPLEDIDYKIVEPKCEFDFFKLHYWLKDIFLDQSDKIGLL